MLPGNVQGVVVHTNKNRLFSSSEHLITGNFIYTEADFMSSYSISASARAVSQEIHQYIGLFAWCIYPSEYNSQKDFIIVASYSWLRVR